MSIMRPQISKELLKVDNFSSYAREFLLEEVEITEIENSEERIEGGEFSKIEIQRSVFENCGFQSCGFENASFIDVLFKSCDFSNSKFKGAYFERCRFVSCKCIGADMSDTIIRQTALEQSNFQYSSFNKARMTDVAFDHVNFTEASMTEAKLIRFTARDSKFVKNNFFKTMLKTVDFTSNEFLAPIVSTPPIELKGAIINTYQAADLIGLWGVIVSR